MIPLLWVDLETTGLDESQGLVLEVAARMTDYHLDETSRFHAVVNYPDDAFALTHLQPVVQEMHTKNGLLEEVSNSRESLETVRENFANWLFSCYKLGEKRPLAGSNPEFDRRWLNLHLPEASAFLHYRSFDMNSIYYFMDIDKNRVKGKGTHRANDDLDHDIDKLRILRGIAMLTRGREAI